jgi:hypothetical protein
MILNANPVHYLIRKRRSRASTPRVVVPRVGNPEGSKEDRYAWMRNKQKQKGRYA